MRRLRQLLCSHQSTETWRVAGVALGLETCDRCGRRRWVDHPETHGTARPSW